MVKHASAGPANLDRTSSGKLENIFTLQARYWSEFSAGCGLVPQRCYGVMAYTLRCGMADSQFVPHQWSLGYVYETSKSLKEPLGTPLRMYDIVAKQNSPCVELFTQ